MSMQKLSKEFLLEWGSTTLVIASVVLNAYNIYPLNIWIAFAGNFGWILIGIMWKKISLVVISILISVIYIAGLVNYYF